MSCSRCQPTSRDEAKQARGRLRWLMLVAALLAALVVVAIGPSAAERRAGPRAAASAR